MAVRTTGRRDERGASALEFGLMAPLLVLVMFAVVQYGYHFWALETGAASAREAARRLAVGTDWTCTSAEAQRHAAMPAIATPVVERAYMVDGAAAAAPKAGALVTVTVRFQSLDMRIFPLPRDGLVVETAQARVENVPRVDEPLPPCP